MYSTKELYSAFRTHSQSTELQKILRVELYYMYSKTYLLVQTVLNQGRGPRLTPYIT